MAKYRNSRVEAEIAEVEEIEKDEQVLKEPAKTVEEETWKKRYGDQQRYLTQIKNETKAEVEELKTKLDQALRGRIRAPKSDEEVDNWVKEYPEFAGILERIVETRVRDATSTTNQKLAAIEEKSKEIDAKEAIIELKRLHSDWDELSRSEKFHSWLKGQSQKYQDAIYRNLDVEQADLVISKYKSQGGVKKSQGGDDDFDTRNAAKVVKKTSIFEEPDADAGDYEFTESQIETQSKKDRTWFERNETKIMSAASRGKIFYDVSGGAR
jgi:hypothetical protein